MSDESRITELLLRLEESHQQGQPIILEELCCDCPELLDDLKREWQVLRGVNAFLTPAPDAEGNLPTVPGYDIEGVLGRGGMGVVYKARQIAPPRLVALKMIQAGRLATAASMERFLGEARAVASLDHPGIVPLALQLADLGQEFRLLGQVAAWASQT